MPRRADIWGMLIAEVLLAMLLLVVVGLLLLGLIPTAGKALAKSRKHAMATQVCRQEIQTARCTAFPSLADRLVSVSSYEVLRGQNVTTTFQVQRRVAVVSDRLKRVEATVSWPGNGLAYVRMATLVRGDP